MLRGLKMLDMLCVMLVCMACAKAHTEERYLAAERPVVVLYGVDGDRNFYVADSLPRKTAVRVNTDMCIRKDDAEYLPVFVGDSVLYVREGNTAQTPGECVLERRIWVRTPASVIDDTLTSHICGLADKGDSYEVVGYDGLDDMGHVNRYKIHYGDSIEGYIFAKYCVFSETEALQRYRPLWQDSVHARVRNAFGGGEAVGCDFYPVEKPVFAGNEMPLSCYALYLNISPAVIGKIDSFIFLARQTKINTFVIDIKDNECPGYKADAMKRYSPTNYKWGGANKEQMYRYALGRLHEEGFYVVGRITCFKDSYFVKDNPSCAVTDKTTGQPFYHNHANWPSAYDRRVWQFNVELAKEAVRKFGFNEINFDYVRFPDRMTGIESQMDYHNQFGESKVQAIQRFVQYACDELHQLDVYVSVDVFGESANRGYTTPYGQYWPALSNVADVMCGMPYPDHFAAGYGGIDKPWNNPYATLSVWAKSVQGRQSETPSPARVRTWIQAYHVMHYVDPEGIDYDAANVEKEIRALFDAGLTGGYTTWLSSSSLERYAKLKKAFSIDYLNESELRQKDENLPR